MTGYLLLVTATLGLMAALPFWDPEGFGTPPLGVLLLLAVAALAMAFRRRRSR
ncbi:MYXO-CTERM sorting domain-containing protein [Roseomonas sp. E05]|uniref:MYXO-CTERM sorting domain-containing protein n=1 Tax=Roseomonas sp. E05 TaxID=3046310 RepID=UPI0024B9C744|nr:MYXO-CTERM sorting domain-containing protein [Roseomonas sp. E05]MDJ0388571.1 MYXO-CTERM sorting domain-containing protein [Roseomonas sp. E05]